MGNKRNLLICLMFMGALMLSFGNCLASENVIYVINNNAPNYSQDRGNYGGGVVCTRGGGICATGRYMLSTARVTYAPPQWKRPTIRERRLSQGKESIPYYQRQMYYNR